MTYLPSWKLMARKLKNQTFQIFNWVQPKIILICIRTSISFESTTCLFVFRFYRSCLWTMDTKHLWLLWPIYRRGNWCHVNVWGDIGDPLIGKANAEESKYLYISESKTINQVRSSPSGCRGFCISWPLSFQVLPPSHFLLHMVWKSCTK